MVSFSCENCGDVLTKKKLDPHRNQCYGASFTCIDCMVHFYGTEYRAHTSCVSEAQKYQGALYRPEKEKKGRNNNQQNHSQALVQQQQQQQQHAAYVEDADDEYNHNSHIEIVEPSMPEAPSPPSAAPGFTHEPQSVNVFDFLVAGSTPNQSRLDLTAPEPMHMIEDTRDEDMESNHERDLVRVRFEDSAHSVSDLIEYGNGPIETSNSEYQTPAPKSERERERKKDRKQRELTREEKKDKKRKRLHVETQDLAARDDESMTDAPPVLHSGLTGGLNRLMSRPSVFPPSPDYSGGDVGEASPGSPLKKTKHTKNLKRGRVNTISNNLMSLISTKRVSSREHSEDRPKRKHRRHREDSDRPARKMIEYEPMNGEEVALEDNGSQLVVYQPRADLLLSFVNKGPDSERGLSMNKALKRYHRERAASNTGLGKHVEEKELWRSLRMKKNDRGEIVLFL
ncbi:related to cell growth regulating nucleolar protein LYAR [Rhynchosporium graminicola]|uniref:Related to cell growth regulating nucleolar protein LYAR n=1 Tax=Rhynchosporium graminicola TaxID=2792576 RepID=A0A1E1KIK9_9HELO|nr:related to cell growth regulating nucleolar protein LYAR [Rhynchosporium commune]